MSWFGDILKSVSGLFDFSDEKPTQITSSAPAETNPPSNISSIIGENTQEPIKLSNPSSLPTQEQESMRMVSGILKDCGVSGMPKYLGNLDLSLPDPALSTGAVYNTDINPNSFMLLHNHLDSPENQAAFNLGVQQNIKNPESLEKFLLRHAGNIVGNDSNFKFYVAQLATDLVNRRDKEPAQLFRQDLKDCLLNYHLTTNVAQGIKFEAHVGATTTPVHNNVGSGIFAKAEISF